MASTIRTTSEKKEAVSLSKVWQWTGISAVAASVLNSILFLVGEGVGWLPRDFVIASVNQPLVLPAVIIATVIGVVLGGAVFSGLAKFTARPITIFRFVGIGALLFSFISPLSIPNAPLAYVLVLEVMHIIAGGLTIYTLTTFTRK